MLLDEPLDEVALLGVGRKLEVFDILGVTLTVIIYDKMNKNNKQRGTQSHAYTPV